MGVSDTESATNWDAAISVIDALRTGDGSKRSIAALNALLESKAKQLLEPPSPDNAGTSRMCLLGKIFVGVNSGVLQLPAASDIVSNVKSSEQFFTDLFKALPKLHKSDPSDSSQTSEANAHADADTLLESMKLVYLSLIHVIPVSSALITVWFKEALVPGLFFTGRSKFVGALAVWISLQFLDIKGEFTFDTDRYSYLADPEALISVHLAIKQNGDRVAPELLLTWGLVLHKLSRALNQAKAHNITKFLQILGVRDSAGLDSVAQEVLGGAIERNALDSLIGNLGALPLDIQYAQTAADVLHALTQIAVITQPLASAIATTLEPFPYLANDFFDNDTIVKFEVLRAKVPASLPAFLELARSVQNVYPWISNLTSFVDSTSAHDALAIQGDKVTTKTELTIFPARPTDGQGAVSLPRGRSGLLLAQPTGNNYLIMWTFQYNGWTLIGRVLENSILSGRFDEQSVAIVKLATSTLRFQNAESIARMLGSLSAGLGPGNIVDTISTGFELSMANFSTLNATIATIQFYTELFRFDPHRVWSTISRSGLLEQLGSSGFVTRAVAAVETVNGRYDFTLAVIELAKKLVAGYAQLSDAQDLGNSYEHTLMKILRHLIDVFESFYYWAYADDRQRELLMTGIVSVLSGALDVRSVAIRKLVTDELLCSQRARHRSIKPLITTIAQPSRDGAGGYGPLKITMVFCGKLLRVRNALDLPYSLLERYLYDISPKIVALYSGFYCLRNEVLSLLAGLIGGKSEEQPSLLAYLGQQSSMKLLKYLNETAGSDFTLDETLNLLANFLAAVGASKQEGLRLLLTRGKAPRSLPGKPAPGESLISTVEKKVVEGHGRLSPAATAALLTILSFGLGSGRATQPAAEISIGLQKVLVSTIHGAFEGEDERQKDDSFMRFSAAQALRILSVDYLGKKSQADKGSELAKFVAFLADKDSFRRYSEKFLSTEVFEYTLHSDVLKILSEHAAELGISARDFAIDELNANVPQYGEDFVYRLEPLRETHGPKAGGILDTLTAANLNLSTVHAQLLLLSNWQKWCVVVASVDAAKFSTQLEDLALMSLTLNSKRDLAVPVLAEAARIRVELSFYLLHRLYMLKTLTRRSSIIEAATRLAVITMDTLLASDDGSTLGSLEVTFRGLHTIRKRLLQILNIELGPDQSMGSKTTIDAEVLATVLREIAIKGIKGTLLGVRYDAGSSAENLMSIISIQRAAINSLGATFPGLRRLGLFLTDNGGDRAAFRLYSDSFEFDSSNPVFGELSLQYILEWIKIDSMAETFVSSGLFTVILESPLSRHIQSGGILASREPRVHSTWRNGLVLIVLVLVQQLGTRVLREAQLFMEFFAPQIRTCLEQWKSPTGEISLALIEETFLLNALLSLLSSHSARDIGRLNLLPKQELTQAIDHLSSHRKYLAARSTLLEDGKYQNAADASEKSVEELVENLAELRRVIDQRP